MSESVNVYKPLLKTYLNKKSVNLVCYLFSNCTFLASSLVNSVANRLGLSPSQAKSRKRLGTFAAFQMLFAKTGASCYLSTRKPRLSAGKIRQQILACLQMSQICLSFYSCLSLLVSLPTRLSPYSCLFLLVSLPTRVSPYSCLFLLVSLPTRLSSYSSPYLLVSLPTRLSSYSSLFLLVSLPTRLSSYSSFSLLVSLPTRLSPYSSLSLPSLSLLVSLPTVSLFTVSIVAPFFAARVHFCPREDELEPIAVGKQRQNLRDF